MMNIFEKATKDKIRFEYKGLLSVEDLWDLNVEELDSIFKRLNSDKKLATEDSLLEVATKENTLLNTKISIVTHIVEYKLEASKTKMLLVERREKKNKIMEILANKQDSELENKTADELKAMLEGL